MILRCEGSFDKGNCVRTNFCGGRPEGFVQILSMFLVSGFYFATFSKMFLVIVSQRMREFSLCPTQLWRHPDEHKRPNVSLGDGIAKRET